MPIKRIVFPLFVLVLVFVALKFIHPAVIAILEQRSLKQEKLAELAAVEKTATNIGSLVDFRESLLSSEDGRAIMSYLPEKTDQDRTVDVLNFLGMRTGAVIGSISFSGDAAAASVASPTEQVVGADGLPITTAPPRPEPASFSVKLEATGGYEGLKSFVERVASMNRLQRITSFSLSKKQAEAAAEGAPASSDTLSLELEVSFLYLPKTAYAGAHLLPVFESSAIDIEPVRGMMHSREAISALPDPELSGRRADPFKF